MKRNPLLLSLLLATVLYSCKGGEDSAATIPATDFNAMVVQHPVANFDHFKLIYFAHDSLRKANGVSHFSFGTGLDDPNMVRVVLKIDDVTRAKAFITQPDLKVAMDSAGVTGPPTFDFVHVLRNDSSKIEQNDRISIKHKVKDFDAWLKVYDKEGMKSRQAFGIIDRAIARGIDDPSLVYIVFAVADWEKANARMNSEELKKLMTDAGVEGPPEFFKYKIAQQ